ncbi:MAG: hypothetical protein RL515_283, partial [Verrucomicrobiota bacterium]
MCQAKESNQPARWPNSKSQEALSTNAPKTNVQSENAFSRGKATSRAPTCSGTRKLKNAADSGMTPRKIIVVPCMVNSWLYMRAVTKSLSGRAS